MLMSLITNLFLQLNVILFFFHNQQKQNHANMKLSTDGALGYLSLLHARCPGCIVTRSMGFTCFVNLFS